MARACVWPPRLLRRRPRRRKMQALPARSVCFLPLRIYKPKAGTGAEGFREASFWFFGIVCLFVCVRLLFARSLVFGCRRADSFTNCDALSSPRSARLSRRRCDSLVWGVPRGRVGRVRACL